jgi:hypothetical protein
MGRIQLYIVAGFIVFSSLCGIYYSWRSGIEREALLEYNQKQLEQSNKDKEETRKRLEEINNAQKKIEAENDAAKKVLKEKLESVLVDLNSKEIVSDDRAASKVLKSTVNKLKDVVK